MLADSDLPFGVKLVSILMVISGLASLVFGIQMYQTSPLFAGGIAIIGLGAGIAGVGLLKKRKQSWALAQLIILISLGLEFFLVARGSGSIPRAALTALILGYLFQNRSIFIEEDE